VGYLSGAPFVACQIFSTCINPLSTSSPSHILLSPFFLLPPLTLSHSQNEHKPDRELYEMIATSLSDFHEKDLMFRLMSPEQLSVARLQLVGVVFGVMVKNKKRLSCMSLNALHAFLRVFSEVKDNAHVKMVCGMVIGSRDKIALQQTIPILAEYGEDEWCEVFFNLLTPELRTVDIVESLIQVGSRNRSNAFKLGSGHLKNNANMMEKVSEETLKCLVAGYARRSESNRMMEAWVKMRDRGFTPEVEDYNSLLVGFNRHNLQDRAFTAFEGMKVNGIEPNPKTYTLLMAAAGKMKKSVRVKEVWNEAIVDERVQLGVPFYATAVAAFANCRRYLYAQQVIHSLSEKKLRPVSEMYRVLAFSASRDPAFSPELRDLALQLSKRLPPNFNTLSSKQLKAVNAVLDHIKTEEVQRLSRRVSLKKTATVSMLPTGEKEERKK